MTHHNEESFFMEAEGGGVPIPTPTWSWSFSGDTTSDPAGNDGVNTGADLVSDSSSNPNEAYQFISANNDRMQFDPVNFGASNFSIYIQMVRDGIGDDYNDILSNHVGNQGWTIEQTGPGANTYYFVGWDGSGLWLTNAFTIPIGTLSKIFVVRDGTVCQVFINDALVATVTRAIGTIISYTSMVMGSYQSVPTDHNADITVDGFRIWNGTALSAAEQTAQIAEGI